MAKKKTTTTVVKAKKGSKVTPEEVKTFLTLYNTYGTYSAVAKMTGRGEATIAKHIKLAIAAGITIEEKEEKKDDKGKKTIIINI